MNQFGFAGSLRLLASIEKLVDDLRRFTRKLLASNCHSVGQVPHCPLPTHCSFLPIQDSQPRAVCAVRKRTFVSCTTIRPIFVHATLRTYCCDDVGSFTRLTGGFGVCDAYGWVSWSRGEMISSFLPA